MKPQPRTVQEKRISPIILDTLRDSWIACKATSKILATRTTWRLGVASTIISAAAATAVFASVQASPATWARLVVAGSVLLAAILAGVQTWYGRQRESLKETRNLLHVLHHDIETAIFNFQEGTPFDSGFAASVARRYADIDTDSIPTAGKPWDQARKEFSDALWMDFRFDPRSPNASGFIEVGQLPDPAASGSPFVIKLMV